MKFCAAIAALVAGFLLAGCNKQPKTPAVPPSIETSLPTQAQARLPSLKLWIGSEEMITEMALTEIQMQTGMMFRTNIEENEGMIFPFPSPRRVSFWMKNCPQSLSAAYLSTDGVIREIHHFEKENTNAVVAASEDIQFVLETKDGWFQRHNIGTGVVVRSEFGPLTKTFQPKR